MERVRARMNDFPALLRRNRNYRYTWSGQIVSEVGDHFNNIAVFSLALANTGSGLVVALILIARAIPAVMAGPIAGVLLDRMGPQAHHDRQRPGARRDRARLHLRDPAWTHLAALHAERRADVRIAIFHQRPRVDSSVHRHQDELHTANSLTQLTQWTTVTIGSFLGGAR